MTDLTPDERTLVLGILERTVPGIEVKAFGSRARHEGKATSDLDLSLMTDAPISPALKMELRLAFSESDLPFRVDILDWSRTGEDFRNGILPDLVPL